MVHFGGEYWFTCDFPFELSSLYVEWLVIDKHLPCVRSLYLTLHLGDLQVLLTTPTTPKERMRAIVEAADGFVYLVRAF